MASRDVQKLVEVTADLARQVNALTDSLALTMSRAYALNGTGITAFRDEAVRISAA